MAGTANKQQCKCDHQRLAGAGRAPTGGRSGSPAHPFAGASPSSQSWPAGRPPAWLIVLAVVAIGTNIPHSLLAQSTRPFAAERQGVSRSRSGRTVSNARPIRSAQPPQQRFSDARPITPSGPHAASAAADKGGTSAVGPSAWKTFGTLAALVVLIVIAGRLWKKHGPKLSGGLPTEAIDVLGKRNVDTRQAIYLVRLGSRILVLGSTASGLRTLAEVTDPVEVDYLAGLCQHRDADSGARQSFRSLFSKQPVVDSVRDSAEVAAANPFAGPEVDALHAVSYEQATSGRAHV